MDTGRALVDDEEMTAHKPYPSYKDTNLPWLGQIPAHWEVKRIKELARQEYKSFVDGDWIESPYIVQDEGVRLIQTGNIGIGKYKEQGYRYITKETFRKLDCTEFFPGDILICRLAEPVGRACLAPDLGKRMITSVDVCILKPQDKYDSKFIVYFLSSDSYLNWLTVLSRGSTRDRISRSMLGDIHIPCPSLPEQQAIATYLDHQTAKIDALIAKKQRLLELLAEQRAALISQAVTKGLNPNVKMKDSGETWLGQIPSHWNVRPLKYAAFLNSETLTEKNDSDYVIQYLDISNVDEIEGVGEVQEIRFENAPSRARRIVRAGDTIVSTVRTYLKAVAYFENPPTNLIVSTGFAVLRPKQGIQSKFLSWLIQSKPFIEKVVTHSVGVGYPAINPSELASLKVWIPSISEQQAISDYLDNQTKRLTDLATKVETAIERLREYRAALISSVVTGKVQVKDE
jgi:type I restriction enzyme S subunit